MVTYGQKDSGSLGFGGLGLLSLGIEGGIFGTGTADPVLLPINFAVRRGMEGEQTVISWGIPSQVTDSTYTADYEVRLERRTLDFTARKSDETVISTDTSPTTLVYAGTLSSAHAISETAPQIKDGMSHYYTLFVKTPAATGNDYGNYAGDDPELWVTSPILKKSVIVLKSSYMTGKLFSALPAFYQTGDSFASLDKVKDPGAILTTATGTGDLLAEKFNFDEDQKIKYGPFYRYLKIFGVHLDEIRGLIEYIPKLYDLDECDQAFLHLLASNVALRFKKGLNVTQQRADLRNIVHFYKWKGTAEAYETRGQAVATARQVAVKEYNEDTFLTNKTDRLTGKGAYRRGKNYVKNAVSSGLALEDPEMLQMTRGGLHIQGHSGLADTVANEHSETGLGAQVKFDELGNQFSLSDHSPYESLDNPGDYTIEGWIKVKRWPKASTVGTTTNTTVMHRTLTTSVGSLTFYTLRVTLNTVRLAVSGLVLHRLAFYVGDTSSATWIPIQFKEELGHIKLNTPVHFAISRKHELTYNGVPALVTTTTYEVYRNGVSLGSSTANTYARQAASTYSAGTGFVFGDSAVLLDSSFVLDDIRVWNIVRTTANILSDYQEPISAHSTGMIFNTGFDYKENQTFYENSPYNNTGAGTTETSGSEYGNQPLIAAGLVTEPSEANDWEISRQQKFFLNDKQWYTSGDPVGINGVGLHVFSERLVEDQTAVIL